MFSYYDIGLNLFVRSFHDPEKIIADAKEAGIGCILTGADPKDNEKVNEFVKTHDVYGTAGIHPHVADSATPEAIQRIREIAAGNPRIVAVGECGLDYDRMFSTKENQMSCFKELIQVAEELNKPLFLHERDAAEDFISCFKGHEAVCHQSVVHCFTGNRQVLETLLSMGFYIGITGWICDERRGQDLQDAVSILPLDRVMLETDAPYLTPRGFGLPRTNVPQNITYVAETLAHYMHVSVEDLVSHAKENTERFFRLRQIPHK